MISMEMSDLSLTCPNCGVGIIKIEMEKEIHVWMTGMKHNSKRHFGRKRVYYMISEKCEGCGLDDKKLKKLFMRNGSFESRELKVCEG